MQIWSLVLSRMLEAATQFRVFAFKDFVRFARKLNISDEEIWDVLGSQPDANLGGGLYKFQSQGMERIHVVAAGY